MDAILAFVSMIAFVILLADLMMSICTRAVSQE
jgi:hypothetical protein